MWISLDELLMLFMTQGEVQIHSCLELSTSVYLSVQSSYSNVKHVGSSCELQSDNHDEVLGTAATDRIEVVNMIIATALTP